MPATIGKVIANALAPALPGLTITRNEVPGAQPGTTTVDYPYITIQEGISRVNNPRRAPTVMLKDELVQVDVWQSTKTSSGNLVADNPSIAITVEQTLNALGPQVLTGNGGFLFRFLVTNTVRLYDPSRRVLHEAITVRVYRKL